MSYIKEQIALIKKQDPSISSTLEVFLHPSFKALLYYKIAHRLYRKKHLFLARLISERGKKKQVLKYIQGLKLVKDFLSTMDWG